MLADAIYRHSPSGINKCLDMPSCLAAAQVEAASFEQLCRTAQGARDDMRKEGWISPEEAYELRAHKNRLDLELWEARENSHDLKEQMAVYDLAFDEQRAVVAKMAIALEITRDTIAPDDCARCEGVENDLCSWCNHKQRIAKVISPYVQAALDLVSK